SYRWPLVLCHGFTSTEYVFDMGDRRSLARYLADAGFDVYVVNLRGRGEGASVPKEVRRRGWSISDYLRYDVPAIISGVLDRSGADRLVWIGHSMGGILGFWHEAATEDERVAALVAISSPAALRHMSRFAKNILSYCPLLPSKGVFPSEAPAKLIAPLAQFWTAFSGWVSNLEDYPQEAEAQYLYNSVPDISLKVVKDFCFAAQRGDMVDLRTGFVLRNNLDRVKVPILVIAGTDDNLAQPHDVYLMYSLAGSGDKRWVEFGRKNGFSHNYGHGDILLGDHARAEVFPVIAEWLDAHNPRLTF
ncbi:MAG TPA: alpha/beta fold hydrolase, partial [Proteobacteria bacterium]|nr:alpha/beta fold hydrolase [Pseudomonadota bacterium]